MEMITYILWFIIVLSLIGKICIIKSKLLQGFCLWAFADSFLMTYNYSIGEYAQSVLFLIFLIFSIWGIISHKNKGGM